MGQLKDKLLGTPLRIREGSENAIYEVAGLDVHAPDSVTLVRRDALAAEEWNAKGSITTYADCILDRFCERELFASFSDDVQNIAMKVSIIMANTALEEGTQYTLLRHCFLLSRTEVGLGINHQVMENAPLPLFSSADRRIKQQAGEDVNWWVRSTAGTGTVRMVSATGTASYAAMFTPQCVVPAIVLPANTLLADAPNDDGTFSIIQPRSTGYVCEIGRMDIGVAKDAWTCINDVYTYTVDCNLIRRDTDVDLVDSPLCSVRKVPPGKACLYTHVAPAGDMDITLRVTELRETTSVAQGGYNYHVESIRARKVGDYVIVTWSDPCDMDWLGTRIVRKPNSYPENDMDGVLIVDSKVRHQYADTGFEDAGLMDGVEYFYKAFPYSSKGVNTSYLNEVSPSIIPLSEYVLTYTGAHTKQMVEHDGRTWEQWALTSSGIMMLESGSVPYCQVCVVGAGAGGVASGENGGGGGYMLHDYDYAIRNDTSASIGAGSLKNGGSTFFGEISANGGFTDGTGGSGGGSGAIKLTTRGKGDGLPKYPFRDTKNFHGKPHCAGGSGGNYKDYTVATPKQINGLTGGSNGSDGSLFSDLSRGALSGGGIGGACNGVGTGGSGTFFGAGGGGGGLIRLSVGTSAGGPSGSGYQGVIYIRIPK